MKTYRTLFVVALVIGLTLAGRHFASARPQFTIMPTGVYSGFCAADITQSAKQYGQVPLYGLGSNVDPFCETVQSQPVPVSNNQYVGSLVLGNLAVASEEPNGNSVPTTLTVYVNGKPTALSCTVSSSSPSCADRSNKVLVKAGQTFSVNATCNPGPTDNCAQGLQATVDRGYLQ